VDIRQILIDQEKVELGLKETIAKGEEAMKQMKVTFGKEREELQAIA
jgi:hypothetical protein